MLFDRRMFQCFEHAPNASCLCASWVYSALFKCSLIIAGYLASLSITPMWITWVEVRGRRFWGVPGVFLWFVTYLHHWGITLHASLRYPLSTILLRFTWRWKVMEFSTYSPKTYVFFLTVFLFIINEFLDFFLLLFFGALQMLTSWKINFMKHFYCFKVTWSVFQFDQGQNAQTLFGSILHILCTVGLV